MSSSQTILMTIDLKKNGGKKSFYTADEISQWISKEVEFYDWFADARKADQNCPFIIDYINKALRIVDNGLSAILSASDSDKLHFINTLKTNIENYYLTGNVIHSTSSEGVFLKKLLDSDVVVACYALGYLIGRIPSQSQLSSKAFKGYMDAWAFKSGINSKSIEKEVLDNLHNEWLEKADAFNTNQQELTNKFEEIHKKIETEADAQVAEHLELINQNKIALTNFIDESNQRLKNIEEAYDKHMALQSSVEYWTGRMSYHANKSNTYSRLVVLLGLLGVSVIILLSNIFFSTDVTEVIKKGGSVKFSDLPLWEISVFIFSISIIIWIERVFVRLTLSQLHLETDAGERVVMAKTYIAMLREGQAPKDDDRKLILASLFRPNTTGIINDDALPFNLDAMQKIIGGSK